MNKLDERQLTALEKAMEDVNSIKYTVDKLGSRNAYNMLAEAIRESVKKELTVSGVLARKLDKLWELHQEISARNVTEENKK